MKVIIQREKLLRPLQLIAGVVERKQVTPILSHVLLIATAEQLQIIGTDTEVELRMTILLDSQKVAPGTIAVSCRKLLDICRTLPDNSMLEIIEKNDRITINAERSKFNLATLPAHDFPNFPAQDNVMDFALAEKTLQNLLIKTAFAIPQQDLRQYLNGLLLEIKDGYIQVLATDGHRMALNKIELPTETNSTTAQVIIPRKGVVELMRLLGDSDTEVEIGLNSNSMRIQGRDFTFSTKLINGKFPNYNKIIPKRGDKNIKLNRQELKQALTRVGVLSSELFRSVHFQLRKNLLRLTANNYEQEEAVEELAINYVGEDLDTTFNINYLLDILNCVTVEEVNFSLKNGESGALIEEIAETNNCLYVVMPIRQ